LWTDPKAHGDLLGGDLDLFDQRSDHLAAQVPVGIGQPGTHFGRELVQPTDEHLQLMAGGHLLGFLLGVLLQGGDALAQAPEPRRALHLANEAVARAADEATQPLAQLGQLRGRGAALSLGAAVLQCRGRRA
jgi:hypothetical protein